MSLRALRLDGDSESLDAIAAEFGVSRETVRRARNELLHRMGGDNEVGPEIAAILASAPNPPVQIGMGQKEGRSLRRLLTMTGPLSFDETLSAWARAAGKPPYGPLPTNLTAFQAWSDAEGGLVILEGSPIMLAVDAPEPLDHVSRFLLQALGDKPNGVDRLDLLDASETAGLKSTTIATALSSHPAIVRLGRGRWGLRGHTGAVGPEHAVKLRPVRRPRPTSFSWTPDGALRIEFTVPQGPSPVVAVPKAVVDIVEGREFHSAQLGAAGRIIIKNARMWGFGPELNSAELKSGDRVSLALNLITGTAALAAAHGKEAYP